MRAIVDPPATWVTVRCQKWCNQALRRLGFSSASFRKRNASAFDGGSLDQDVSLFFSSEHPQYAHSHTGLGPFAASVALLTRYRKAPSLPMTRYPGRREILFLNIEKKKKCVGSGGSVCL
ncbi:hypothetical protein ABB37_04987 [Leptomonas pyrrhocoris]|uniref:Uncharacterized protein n=1 Tax=Leptomonas pyrrhocoris TaxID=157538 RepID=A0A0M9G0M3_LEPPY|nr:hypothetical protein ABB37_04987 [Leptomonas pyrrhocoris]KPA79935.1 hypothetical protein ABB37_04987 [Leptomonas pyrrhocoris]|eukprot:XP_015658374.1 hypothetical protein ABB37_04987 [Leptomonas pyrrhocoris]